MAAAAAAVAAAAAAAAAGLSLLCRLLLLRRLLSQKSYLRSVKGACTSAGIRQSHETRRRPEKRSDEGFVVRPCLAIYSAVGDYFPSLPTPMEAGPAASPNFLFHFVVWLCVCAGVLSGSQWD